MIAFDVEVLNHASVVLSAGGAELLTDPWLEGTAFSGGWGLRYENPDALARAARATHLWISHWHSDHLHGPTLQKLAKLAPEMVVLANESVNFSMVGRMRELGFTRVVPLPEREAVHLGQGVSVIRHPTAGIDNALHFRAPGASVLNYNDCNLPMRALDALRDRVGPVDLLLTNYNHAGKLFDDDLPPAATKDRWYDAMVSTVNAVRPRLVVPFASSHQYRAPDSLDQNASLLDFDELEARAPLDPRMVILRVGDRLRVRGDERSIERREPRLAPVPVRPHEYGPPVEWAELTLVVSKRCLALGKKFPAARLLAPPLLVEVSDHQRTLRVHVGEQATEVDRGTAPDIRASSRAILDWHGRKFGDDTFFAGAHFAVVGRDTRAIRAWALLSLLDASHLDPRSLVRYLTSRRGRAFLSNRREEIWATLVGARFRAGDLRI